MDKAKNLDHYYIINCNKKNNLNLCFTHKNSTVDLVLFKQDTAEFTVFFETEEDAISAKEIYIQLERIKPENTQYLTVEATSTNKPLYKLDNEFGIPCYATCESVDKFFNISVNIDSRFIYAIKANDKLDLYIGFANEINLKNRQFISLAQNKFDYAYYFTSEEDANVILQHFFSTCDTIRPGNEKFYRVVPTFRYDNDIDNYIYINGVKCYYCSKYFDEYCKNYFEMHANM